MNEYSGASRRTSVNQPVSPSERVPANTSSDDTSPNTLTVTELCSQVNTAIDNQFPREVWVEGVLSSLKRSNAGHVYFDLVDSTETLGAQASSVVPVTLFSETKQRVNRILKKSGGTRMSDGVKVRIRGAVKYYAPQGRVQLIMSLIDPDYTIGQMAADKEKLLADLKAKGLLGRNGLVPMPTTPLRAAVISSLGSAAYEDFCDEINSSGFNFDLIPIDCRVQGLDAVPTVVNALKSANNMTDSEVDVIVLIRGGGARGDLVAFDSRGVALAIAESRIPVITGIGHEIDHTVADDVAHKSCKTPTAAANHLVGLVSEQYHLVTRNSELLRSRAKQAIDQASAQLEQLSTRIQREALNFCGRSEIRLVNSRERLVAAAMRAVDSRQRELEVIQQRISQAPKRTITSRSQELDLLATRIKVLDPKHTLERGWTITRNAEGKVIKSSTAVKPGDQLTTVTKDGEITSTAS